MEEYRLFLEFGANGMCMAVCLYMIAKVLTIKVKPKRMIGLIVVGALLVTISGLFSFSIYQQLCTEGVLAMAIIAMHDRRKLRMTLFLTIFYEIGVFLWDLIVSAGLGILFAEEAFVNRNTLEYTLAIWCVRILMVLFVVLWYRGNDKINGFKIFLPILTLFGMISIYDQSVIELDEELLSNGMLFAIIFVYAILIYNLSRGYEREKEVARLRAEQNELLEKEYNKLNQIYTANAKLYHDLHNHMEILHGYLKQRKLEDAESYLEELRTPIKDIIQTVWTGDEAIDYLINSKLTVMKKEGIQVSTNIEYPHNIKIKGADMTAVLGNLLDNAMEAVIKCRREKRFVNLTIRRINQMLIIKVENSYAETPQRKEGQLETTKEDKQHHGWGLKSARAAVEQYDGTLETSFKENVFRAVATLYFE